MKHASDQSPADAPLAERAAAARLRIAILATPRSGNTWLRSLVGTLYDLRHIVCDQPEEVPWQSLPERCVVQLHWTAEEELIERLRRHEVRAVTVTRHPLDTLISVLHFSTTWAGTTLWHAGADGSEETIRGALPTSDEFAAYAVGPRAARLLSISPGWIARTDCLRVRYEDLVRDPQAELSRLAAELAPASGAALRAAIAANGMDRHRAVVSNQHFWMGRPGQWRRLLPPALAERLVQRHTAAFACMDYDCNPDPTLTAAQADTNWLALEALSLRQELQQTRSQLLDARSRLAEAETLIGRCEDALSQFQTLRELGPQSIRVAQRLHAAALSHPRIYGALMRVVRPLSRRAG